MSFVPGSPWPVKVHAARSARTHRSSYRSRYFVSQGLPSAMSAVASATTTSVNPANPWTMGLVISSHSARWVMLFGFGGPLVGVSPPSVALRWSVAIWMFNRFRMGISRGVVSKVNVWPAALRLATDELTRKLARLPVTNHLGLGVQHPRSR